MSLLTRQTCNGCLDKLVRPETRLLTGISSAFRASGYVGLALAVLLSMSLAKLTGLSPRVMAGIALAAVSSFFVLAMLTKVMTGMERLVYYRHEIAVMVVAGTLLWLLHQPILPYLDVTILGVGMFLVCGRLGCFMVGCCHGVPHSWGVRYGAEHARAGFTPYYVGVRLFPIQAVESVWVLGIVVVGSLLVLGDQPPGTALAWYVVTYGLGRFGFEFMRGDPERPFALGISEAQWTSLLLVLVVSWADVSGRLPLQAWHLGAAAGLVATTIAVAASRRFGRPSRYELLHPRHVKEVAETLGFLSDPATPETALPDRGSSSVDIRVRSTSLGIRISAGEINLATGRLYHYALSRRNRVLLEGDARALASLVLQLKHPSGSSKLIEGNRGVFHLFIRDSAGAQSRLHHTSNEILHWTTFPREAVNLKPFGYRATAAESMPYPQTRIDHSGLAASAAAPLYNPDGLIHTARNSDEFARTNQ